MSDIAIRVENLGKKYKIGANQARYQTLRESIMNGVSNSLEHLKGNHAKEENIIWALKDINFEVKHGEVLGIIGRNGAGKSTLLKILSRITKPTTGRFELNGRVGSLLEVGTGFHPELTGRENIYLSGAILGMKRVEIDHKFDEIVDFSEIEKFLDTPVKHYSSGMFMRLAFSVAAHLEPEILLVDEVLAVGDADFQKKCLGKMGDVAGEGRTVLFVSHNMDAIKTICPQTIYLNFGKLIDFGDPERIIDIYLNTKNFFIPNHIFQRENPLILEDYFLTNIESQKVNSIYFRQPFILNFLLSSSIKGQGNVLLRINSNDGQRIASVSGTEIGHPYIDYFSNFLLQIKIKNNVLNPGKYFPELIISNPYQMDTPDIQTDKLPELLILPKVINEGTIKYYTSKHGWVYLESSIEILTSKKNSL